MPWFAKSGTATERHVLNSTKSRHLWPEHQPESYAESMCGVELDADSSRDDALSSCVPCHKLYDAENGITRRTVRAGGNAKLPRCKCPDCGGTHIRERDHVTP